jgi:hypothetical protein
MQKREKEREEKKKKEGHGVPCPYEKISGKGA